MIDEYEKLACMLNTKVSAIKEHIVDRKQHSTTAT